MTHVKVIVSLDKKLADAVDELRKTDCGVISRSGFVANLILKAVEAHDEP
jgi:metal-responsive CopG/Arc/MetJ family transcriptional regulator